ncbi:MAG: LamG domain-containing protein [Candidatus Aenigmarchaeota archaeon]|nr:LamG domain-containing protein [Candidatus Aenigmarchaeota archaeon]
MKGITPIVSIVILLLITIAVAGAAYTYINIYSTSLTSQVIQIQDTFGNTVIIQNVGSLPVDSDDIQVTVDGAPTTFTTSQIIQPGQSASLTIVSLSVNDDAEINIKGPGGVSGSVSYVTDLQVAAAGTADNPPTVTLDSPANGANVPSGLIDFQCTGNDDQGIKEVQPYGNWTSGGPLVPIGSPFPYLTPYSQSETHVFSQSITPGSPTTYSWDCEFTDNSTAVQKANASAPFTVTVNPAANPAPAVALVLPADLAVVTSPVAFSCDVSDDQGGLNVDLMTNITGTLAVTASTAYTGPTVTETKTFNIGGFSQGGSYNWTCRVDDGTSTTQPAVRRLGVADTMQPSSVTLDSPLNAATRTTCSVTFICSATDNVALDSLLLYHDIGSPMTFRGAASAGGAPSFTAISSPFTYPSLNYGSYNWYCAANDTAGNMNSSQSSAPFTFTVANGNNPPSITAPTISPASPSKAGPPPDNLTCNAGTKSDLDCSDPSLNTVHYNWLCTGASCGGLPVIALNMPFNRNATAAGVINDTSGQNNNGQLGGAGGIPGTKPTLINGRIGKAYDFDMPGTNTQNIRIPDDPTGAMDFGATDNFTIEGWIRLDAIPSSSVIIEKYHGGSPINHPGYALRVGSLRELRFRLQDGTSFAPVVNSSNGGSGLIPIDGQFHHFAAVRKGSPSPKKIFLYLDGVDVTVQPNDDGTLNSLANSNATFVGNNYAEQGLNFPEPINAAIDELIIWRRALAIEEIQRHAAGDYRTLVNQELNVGEDWKCTTTPIDPDGNGGATASSGTVLISS